MQSDAPRRIQMKRTKGWKAPEGAVYVGRPTIWGNHHDWKDWLRDWRDSISSQHDAGNGRNWCRDRAAQAFEEDIKDGLRDDLVERLQELRGKLLMCWCKEGSPCHGDVLLRLANAPAAQEGERADG